MTFGKDFTQAVEQKQIAQQGKENTKTISLSLSVLSSHFLPMVLTARLCSRDSPTEAERAKFIVERVSSPYSPSSPLPLSLPLTPSSPSPANYSLNKKDKPP